MNQTMLTYLDLRFVAFNPDGRYAFVGTNDGCIYVYNTFDFSFHYTYLIQNKQLNDLTAICFHPNNSNMTFVGNSKGELHFYPNLLHYTPDVNVKEMNLSTQVSAAVPVKTISVSSSGE